LADAKTRGIKPNGLREIGALLKQGRMAVGNMETVPIAKIVASEDMLDGKHLDALTNHKATTGSSGEVTLLKTNHKATTGSSGEVTLLKYQGKYYAQDGNHRIAAAAARGDNQINALVLDMDNI